MSNSQVDVQDSNCISEVGNLNSEFTTKFQNLEVSDKFKESVSNQSKSAHRGQEKVRYFAFSCILPLQT